MLNTTQEINCLAQNDVKTLVKLSEDAYRLQIKDVINKTIEQKDCRILLLAGPSGSGKTTSAHILEEGFKENGVDAEVVSLDNFYLNIDQMPLDENGKPDFETVYSLNIPEIHKCFEELLTREKTTIPIFDFAAKGVNEYREIDIENHGILIIEGLHAINPILTDNLPTGSWLSVYISPQCSVFGTDGEEILDSKGLRLARRMSRDYLYRNTSAAGTLNLWTSVISGEQKYLYPFKEGAYIKLKTFHSFEPCVFKSIILKLLEDLNPNVENYDEAMKLKNALEGFYSLSQDIVPENSLIREFILGSKY